ncbi:MAG: sulfatase-like hydrolase/transferase [Candidatus Brocadiia bacterium]
MIVIVADSLRYDHVGCCGGKAQTPNLDRFAAEAMVFDQAYAENLPTLPCRTAWWTGLYLFPQRGWQHFEPWDTLLAEVLWDKGFASALVTDVYHMHKPVYNCGRGFDTTVFLRGQEYDPWVVDTSIPVDVEARHRVRGRDDDARWRERFAQYLRNVHHWKSEEDHFCARVAREAIRWLDHATRRRKDRLFLWVDFFDPHEPWDPPQRYVDLYDPDYTGQELIDPVPGPVAGYMSPEEVAHTRALYAGEVSLVDRWVGVLLDHVRELGLWENSLVMFTSDHGEPFGEHGIIRKAAPWSYEEQARIPWMVRHPEGLGAGQRSAAFVQPPDLMPTVLDALGLPTTLTLPSPPPAGHRLPRNARVGPRQLALHGQSLLPLLRGDGAWSRDFAVTAWHEAEWAIRTDPWTYLLPLRGERRPELYNRRDDLQEQRELSAEEPDVADALELSLRRFAHQVSPE